MNTDFPRIMTFLRKEKGISQKQAAADLNISQALLSHYEKGIRECGLDFLVKAAEYYNVSCDYLLGRTIRRELAQINPEDLPDSDELSGVRGTMANRVNKKLLSNTNAVIFDLLARLGNTELTGAVSDYLMSAQYRMFRIIYSAEKDNSTVMFSLPKERFDRVCGISMELGLARICGIIEKKNLSLPLSPDMLSAYFEDGAASLFSVIQRSEKLVNNIAGYAEAKDNFSRNARKKS